jgi:hypothetical protein
VSDGDVVALSVGELVEGATPALLDVVSDGDDDGDAVGFPTGVMSLRRTSSNRAASALTRWSISASVRLS